VNSSGRLTAQGLVDRPGPAAKAFRQAHASGTAWARPRTVAAHRIPVVAWPVRLTGGLSGAKVDEEIVLEEGATRWTWGGGAGAHRRGLVWWGGMVGGAAERRK
jgi:hypothetical protein